MNRLRHSLGIVMIATLAPAGAAFGQSSPLPAPPQAVQPGPPGPPATGRVGDPQMLLDRLFAQLHKAKNKKTAKAIEQGIWGLWSRSSSPTANALLGQAAKAMTASNYRVAIRLLDTAVELKPDFAEAWNKRATAFYLDHQLEKSLADIEKVLDLEPRHFGALSGRGLIRREQGDDAAALKAFRRALVIHPHLPAAKRAVKELETEFEQRI